MPTELELSFLQEMAADRDLRTGEQARDRAKRRSLGDHRLEGGSIEALDPPSQIEHRGDDRRQAVDLGKGPVAFICSSRSGFLASFSLSARAGGGWLRWTSRIPRAGGARCFDLEALVT